MEPSRKEKRRRSRSRQVVHALTIWLVLGLTVRFALGALAAEPANEHFNATWSRTDEPVDAGLVSRTWMWGPEGFTMALTEPYADAPGGERQVQYFDKSRMEINDPSGDSTSPWYVTNGLLVVELVTGNFQLGDATFEQHEPAEGNVAGDQDALDSPSYQTMALVLNAEPLADGQTITWKLDRSGQVSDDPSLASYGVTAAHHVVVPGIDHQVASPFWEFMNSSGMVYEDGAHLSANLFLDPFYATGYPITEAYWATVKVAGTYQDVLLQCFERRCLTYTPGNAEGWQVEAGNVGQHYYAWRYEQIPAENGNATPPDDGTVPDDGTPPADGTPTESPDDPEAPPTGTETPDDPEVPPTATETPPDDTPGEAPPDTATDYRNSRSFGGPVDPDLQLDGPSSIAVDEDGTLYVAESARGRVQMYTASGGYLTHWSVPDDLIAVAPGGRIYVVNGFLQNVEVRNSQGDVLYGWPIPTCNGSPSDPYGVAADANGSLYITDAANDRVMKLSSLGVIEEEWGNGSCDTSTVKTAFNTPTEIAVFDGKAYVADAGNERIQVLDTSAGSVLASWYDSNGRFSNIRGLAVNDAGYVYAPSLGSALCSHCIVKIDSTGAVVDQWGIFGDGPSEFKLPSGIAIEPNGNVYVVDFTNERVQVFDEDGNYLDQWNDGSRGKLPDPTLGMTLDANGNIYLVDEIYSRVQVFDPSGAFLYQFGESGTGRGQIAYPIDIAASPDGYLYLLDAGIDRVQKFEPDGTFVTEWGTPGTFDAPRGIAVDAAGYVYVADTENNRIVKYDGSGAQVDEWNAGDGPLNQPHEMVVDGDRIYVADTFNHRIQVFDRDGNYLDGWGEPGEDDGQFEYPVGLAVDGDGYVFVVDKNNHRVQKFRPDGTFVTAFGSEGGGNNQLSFPWRIEVTDDGEVYVLDVLNYRVQVFLPVPPRTGVGDEPV